MQADLSKMTSNDVNCPITGGRILLHNIVGITVLDDGDCMICLSDAKQDYPIPGKTLLDLLPMEDFLRIPKQPNADEAFVRKSAIQGYLKTDRKFSILVPSGCYDAPHDMEAEIILILNQNEK